MILHTPGGDIAATENIVRYLKSFFCGDIRAIIPQISMSAGTMTACACKEILMGKQSNLGPIDPQTRGIPCQGVIEEFKRAIEEVKKNPDSLFVWQTIINKYPPTFIGECQKAIEWSQSMVTEWLENGMFAGEENAKEKAEKVSRTLSSHEKHKTHNRHLSAEDCLGIGLKIKMIESNQKLQDAILSVHHAFMISLDESNAPIKIVENIDEAISHINTYGSGHSEAIITTNYNNALKFQKLVDASAVYVNASTRFTDGNEFGFGAEIGISTQKLHARGPMGLEALTTMKYLIYGEGQIR